MEILAENSYSGKYKNVSVFVLLRRPLLISPIDEASNCPQSYKWSVNIMCRNGNDIYLSFVLISIENIISYARYLEKEGLEGMI